MTERREVSAGQKVLEAWAGWISSWIVFPELPSYQEYICALWAMHTHFAPKWPATAYLHITGDGPGVGKSTLLQVLMRLSLNPAKRDTLRALEIVRAIKQATERDGAPTITLFLDESEKLAHMNASDERSILTTGYALGGVHAISVGGKSVEFPTYCAKAFASIGGLEDVMRSRSILTRLTFGVPARVWSDAWEVRDNEGRGQVDLFRRVMQGKIVRWTPPDFMVGREREIWSPIWSVANALDLDAQTLKRIRQAMQDTSAYKATIEAKSYRELRQEPKDVEREYAVRALRDLALVLPERDKTHTGDISSELAVTRMKELDGPWRVFRGKGLDPVALASLVSRFGLSTGEDAAPIRMLRGRGQKQYRGYSAAAVRKALETLEAVERGEA